MQEASLNIQRTDNVSMSLVLVGVALQAQTLLVSNRLVASHQAINHIIFKMPSTFKVQYPTKDFFSVNSTFAVVARTYRNDMKLSPFN